MAAAKPLLKKGLRQFLLFASLTSVLAYSQVSLAQPDSGPALQTTEPVDECESAHAEWVFCSGFEEGSLDIWDDWDGNPPQTNLIMEDPGPEGLPGNHVMRLRVPPGGGIADLVKVLPDKYDRLYARWYVKWEPGYDFSARCHGSGLYAGDRSLMGQSGIRPDGSDRFHATLEPSNTNGRLFAYTYYRGMYMDCHDPEGSCWGDHFPCMIDEGQYYCTKEQHRESVLPPVMQADRWYCIEMMLDGGTPTNDPAGADGVLDFWIDGVRIGPWTDLWLRTTPELKLGILWLALYHHGEHSEAGIMIDNVVVSTQRIGAIGAGTGSPVEKDSWGGLKARFRPVKSTLR